MARRSDGDVKHVRNMSLDSFLQYSQAQQDENPAYIFDAVFGTTCPRMLEEYSVPEPFKLDFMEGFGNLREKIFGFSF